MAVERKSDVRLILVCAGFLFVANFLLFAVETLPARKYGLPDWSKTVEIIAGVVMTLAIFSFLYRDNPLFRAAENLFVGLGLGIAVAVAWYDTLKKHVYDVLVAPVFDPTVDVQHSELIRIVPVVLGVMILLRISRKHGWISRYPMAIIVGFWAGWGIQPTIHSNIFRQITATIVPTPMAWPAWVFFGCALALFAVTAYFAPKGGVLATVLKVNTGLVALLYIILRANSALLDNAVWAEAFNSIDRLIILVGVLAVLFYFFFSLEHKGTVGAISRVGIIFLMVAFGASFGYTVMARESLLIGRFQFLLGDWLGWI